MMPRYEITMFGALVFVDGRGKPIDRVRMGKTF